MKNLGYYNTKIDTIENLMIPFADRACFFGDAVYEATYTHNFNPYLLEEHIERFYKSLDSAKIKTSLGKKELALLLKRLIKMVDTADNFLYWQMSRGGYKREHCPDENAEGNLWVMITEKYLHPFDKSLALRTEVDNRHHYCNIKNINLLPNVLSNIASKDLCCDETIYIRNGFVTECSHSNITLLKNKTLIMHPKDNLILSGIALQKLEDKAKKIHLEVIQREFSIEELFSADEVIVTSSGSLCITAKSIDSVKIGGKAPRIINELQQLLLKDFIKNTK